MSTGRCLWRTLNDQVVFLEISLGGPGQPGDRLRDVDRIPGLRVLATLHIAVSVVADIIEKHDTVDGVHVTYDVGTVIVQDCDFNRS